MYVRYVWVLLVLGLADFIMNIAQSGMAISMDVNFESTVWLPMVCYALAGAYVTFALRGNWVSGAIGGLVYSLLDSTLGVWETNQLMIGRANYQPIDMNDLVTAIFFTLLLGAMLGGIGGWVVARAKPDSDDRMHRRRNGK